ncbi:MAG: molybdopterin-dependent oxidoreductase [Pseudomonadota bacterium]
MNDAVGKLTATHWGNYRVSVLPDGSLKAKPAFGDVAPSMLGRSLEGTRDAGSRIAAPMVREGYLRHGRSSPGEGRGHENFVSVGWDEALDLAANAIRDVRTRRGDAAVYGSSYGWASAGRFHHAQSQIHRFLRMGGGYTDSVNDYSAGAAQVIVRHITGMTFYQACTEAPPARDIAAHCKLIVCFGGASLKNNEMTPGGMGSHDGLAHLTQLKAAGVQFVSVSAIRDDAAAVLDAEWLRCRPNSDVALMLALGFCVMEAGLHDRDFLTRHCEGFGQFANYLSGRTDGQPKNAAWAARLTGIPAERIQSLAVQMATQRSIIGLSLSLQRGEHGEQPYWAATSLAAMLGHIGLPGGGIVYGYGTLNMSFTERRKFNFSIASLPQGINDVGQYIPVARLTDMLERPGEPFDYNGHRLTYPDIGLVYWSGGNPFHHHQDLNRLAKAWAKPETIIVNEMYWTATARRADIVFPVATPLERNDFAAASGNSWITPMHRVVAPFGSARTDFEVFTGLAERLGYRDRFTEGRSEMDWVRHLYDTTRENAAKAGVTLPAFDDFWAGEPVNVAPQLPELVSTFESFRADPQASPLQTLSGKLELFSAAIESFDYADCRGHAAWYDKTESMGSVSPYPLHLISSQPASRLHSQLDNGIVSRERKVKGREPVRIHPQDARARGIKEGDVVRLFNARGATLAGAVLSDELMPGVVQLPTGAWFDSREVDGHALEVHGNPNALTRDIGTSRLAQGCTAHSCLCELERYDGPLPEIRVFSQPPMAVPSPHLAG